MPLDPEPIDDIFEIISRSFEEGLAKRDRVVEYRPVVSADGSRTVLAPATVAVPADAETGTQDAGGAR